jgi:hypothetical protein
MAVGFYFLKVDFQNLPWFVKTFHWKKGKGRGVEKAATMDYQGQKLAELLYYWIIITFGVSCH